jgi:uncharacterized protein DUF5994
MASPAYRPDSSASLQPPQAQLDPRGPRQQLLDGGWWSSSTDLDAELRVLVPLLDQVRGPVVRLLLSPAGWATRPHRIITDDRTVTIGYQAGQAPSMMKVICSDGGTFTMRVALLGPAPGAPGQAETGRGEDGWPFQADCLGLLPDQAIR